MRPSRARVSATTRSVSGRGGRWAHRATPTGGPRPPPAPAPAWPVPADSVAPSSPSRGVAPHRRAPSSATCRSAAHSIDSGASGRPSRRLSATVPGTNTGRCGSHAIFEARRLRRRLRRPRSTSRGAPASTRQQRGLAAPGRAGDRDTPRSGTRTETSSSAGTARPGICTRHVLDPQRTDGTPDGAVSRHHRPSGRSLEGRNALGGGVELGADPAQRPVRLGRQQQHDERSAEGQDALRESDADRHRDQRDRQRRDQLQHRRRRERDPQGAEGGRR